MRAEQLMESVITAAQEGRNLMVRAVKHGVATEEGERFLLVPIPYRKDFILVYYGEQGQDDDDFYAAEGSRLEYGGFIFTRNKRWYDYRYYVLSCLTGDDFKGIVSAQGRTSLTTECEKLFGQRITEYFLNSEDAKKPYNLSGYNINDVLSLIVSNANVSEMTLFDLTKSYNFIIPEKINEFCCLEDLDGYISELVEKSYDVNKTKLRHAQVILHQMKKDYKKLQKNTQHPIWKKAEMVRVIPNQTVKVSVTFKIGSCFITEKMKAEPLVSGINTELIGRDLPPNVCAILKASYNGTEGVSISLEAIESISFRKEILYCKRDFMKELEKRQNTLIPNKEDSGNDM